ncbi:MAG: protein kinase, partial [Deltaproteobacteria bacterium]|nr:protein kinase [Deltaproteobacteria bacterium]
MAEVFKAKSYGVEGFEKIIAIKRILPTMGEDRDFIKMFIDEAKIAGQLAHANICQIFELGRIDGSHFIAMEYIWGKDLLQIQNRLRKIKQQMPIQMACFSIAKVLEGLDYAHRKRDPLGRPLEIVHRDCSPQNVLVSYEGEVKVIDFGIAKATSRNSRTMAGVLKGKFGYMSPEQVRGLPLDRRSDIFAIGTMLYECLTSERLFQGETDFSTLEKVRNVDVQNPRAINPNIPEAIERIIMKALAKDVDDRYQWCSEMLADLQAFLMSQEVVFTAKSLSSWLKEVFTGEIEKERALLETYKRVGRDGLIAGVPAAAAKMDVVETLGEAGDPEGDSTQLGSPNFDDLEAALAAKASPSIGPALGSPASRGPTPAPAANRPSQATKASTQRDEDRADGDFGEEAPTEIFGELEHGVAAAASAKPVAPTPVATAPRAHTASVAPLSRPPRPPPGGRTPTQAPPLSSPQMVATSPAPSTHRGLHAQNNATTAKTSVLQPSASNPAYVPAQASPSAQGHAAQPVPGYLQNQDQPAQSHGYGQTPQMSGPPPQGTPSSKPLSSQLPQLASPAKTLMGGISPVAAASPTAGNYGPNYRVTGQQAAYPGTAGPGMTPQGYPSHQTSQPSQPHMHASQPSMQYSQHYPSNPSNPLLPGYQSAQSQPYAQQNPGPAAAIETQHLGTEAKKRSSIGRDVAIGVAIAGLVLGGFLAVKFLVLDKDKGTGASSGSATASGIATIRLSLPKNVQADLYVDDKKIATVSDGQEIPVSAGSRKVKLLGPSNAKCEQKLELPGGKTTPVECGLKPSMETATTGSAAGSSSAASGSAASGSASGSGAGSAASGSASGSGAG